MTQKIIIGLVGPMVAGKGTIAAYLQKHYDAAVFGFSSPLRDILLRLHLPLTRENMAGLSSVLRARFGENLIADAIAGDIAVFPKKIIVLDGIRRLADINAMKDQANFYLVKVETGQRLRYERLLKRTQNADDGTKTFESFQTDEQAEADRQIPEVMKFAKYAINNDGTMEELYDKTDELMEKILKQQADEIDN